MSLGTEIALIKALCGNGSGSGGGVLVVTATVSDNNTMTLDKTWQEIKDADAVSVVIDGEEGRNFLFCTSALAVKPLGGGDTRYIARVCNYGAGAEIMVFIASSASGYPSYTIE